MEVSQGLRDEYSKIMDVANGDISTMYLNYGDGSADPTSLDPGYKSSTPTLDSMYSGMVAKDALLGSAKSTLMGRGMKGILGGMLTGRMPNLESLIDPTSLSIGFASKLPGAMVNETLGLNKGYNKVGGMLGGVAGSIFGGPVGGMMGSMFGRIGASGLMDALGLRDDEAYRDYIEDEDGWLRAQFRYAMEMDPNYDALTRNIFNAHLNPQFTDRDLHYDLEKEAWVTRMEPLQYDASYTPDYVSALGTPATSTELGMPYDGYSLDFDSDIGSLGGFSDPMSGFDDGWGDFDTDNSFGFDSGLDSSFGGWGDSETDTAFGENDGFGLSW